MDYRHTEDFARQMEAAALRAPALRAQAIAVFWGAILDGMVRAFRSLRQRLSGAVRAGNGTHAGARKGGVACANPPYGSHGSCVGRVARSAPRHAGLT